MSLPSFNGRRFATLLRKDWTENWKQNVQTFFLLYAGLATYFCFCTLPDARHAHRLMLHAHSPEEVAEWQTIAARIAAGIDNSWENMDTLIHWIPFLFVLLSGSVYRGRYTKNDRIRNLTLPVSAAETFLLRFVRTVPLLLFGSLALFLAADYTRVFVCNALYPGLHYASPQFSFAHFHDTQWMWANTTLLAAVLFIQSVFVAVSETRTLWPTILGYLFILLVPFAMSFSGFLYKRQRLLDNLIQDTDFLLGWTLFFIAGFILNWYLAYRHLRQADLTYCKLSKE